MFQKEFPNFWFRNNCCILAVLVQLAASTLYGIGGRSPSSGAEFATNNCEVFYDLVSLHPELTFLPVPVGSNVTLSLSKGNGRPFDGLSVTATMSLAM